MRDYQIYKEYEAKLATTELGKAFLDFERLSTNFWIEDGKIALMDDPSPRSIKGSKDSLAKANAARKILTDLILLKA